MTIEGEYLGEPATVKVEGDRVGMTYRIGGRPGAWAAMLDALTFELRPARFRGLEPFHAFALFFAIGAYFAHMTWLAVAFAAAGIAHGIYRLVEPPQVLVLVMPNERRELVVARRSLGEARDLVRLRAAR